MIDKYINKIIQGDCLEILKELPDNSIDLIITSPPYNVGGNNCPDRKNIKYHNSNDCLKEEDYFSFLYNALRESIRISKYVCFNVQSLSNNQLTLITLKYVLREYFKDEIIWVKTNPAPAINKGCLNSGFEYIWIFASEDNNKRSFDNAQWQGIYNNVISTPVFCNNEFRKIHNACFPIEIPIRCIEIVPDANLILDPFCGTGTTCVAAKMLGRRYIGIDLSEEYCQIAESRLKEVDTGVTVKEQRAGQTGFFENN